MLLMINTHLESTAYFTKDIFCRYWGVVKIDLTCWNIENSLVNLKKISTIHTEQID